MLFAKQLAQSLISGSKLMLTRHSALGIGSNYIQNYSQTNFLLPLIN